MIVLGALRDLDVRGVCVTIRQRRNDSPSGKGWYREWWIPAKGEDRPQIRITLPSPGIQPAPFHPHKRVRGECPVFVVADWREKLLALVAHEGMHARQTPRNGYGTTKQRGRYVEAESDMAAYRAVMRYRGGNDER